MNKRITELFTFNPPSVLVKIIIIATALLIFTGTDLLVKEIAHQTLRGSQDIIVIPGFWSFRYTINHDLGFSLLNFLDDIFSRQQKFIFLLIIQGLATGAVLVFSLFVKKPKHFLPLVLVSCGGMGNFLDRIIHGGVVDYILWYYGDFRWPIFNLADVYGVVGIIIFIIILYFFTKERSLKALIKPEAESSGQT
ncbi:MAG: signal peptidase II [Spirochaetales bacterium]|nr:signal peptidase II [Spirochaetales bacterium]